MKKFTFDTVRHCEKIHAVREKLHNVKFFICEIIHRVCETIHEVCEKINLIILSKTIYFLRKINYNRYIRLRENLKKVKKINFKKLKIYIDF